MLRADDTWDYGIGWPAANPGYVKPVYRTRTLEAAQAVLASMDAGPYAAGKDARLDPGTAPGGSAQPLVAE